MDADAGSSRRSFHRGLQMAVDKVRIAFGPEAMSRFGQIIEEVSLNLIDDGLTAELVRSDEMRRKLAQSLLGFASHWWTDTQIKQLLLKGAAQPDLGFPPAPDRGGDGDGN